MLFSSQSAFSLACSTKQGATSRSSAVARASRWRYLVVIVLLPTIAILGCIRLGSSDFFLRHGASVWVQSNDAVFNIHDRDCDVLIFGDSTAMTGINPELVERNTGFRTCNISVTNAVLAVTRNLTLDQYLAHNVAPRVLLIQLSPDGFQPDASVWEHTVYPEGLLELLRHGSPAEVRKVLLAHPQQAIAFAGYSAGFTLYAGIKEAWFQLTSRRPEEDLITVRNGFFTPPAPASTSCIRVAPRSNPSPNSDFPRDVVAEYKSAYAQRAGVVLVNVAPTPACDQNLTTYRAELNGVTSNRLTPLPVAVFNDTPARHYTAVGSAIVSRMVAQQLNSIAQSNPQIDDRIPMQMPSTVARLQRARLGR